MKFELYNTDVGYEIHFEPEGEVERCALDYLASRPKHTVFITNTRLGVFMRNENLRPEPIKK